MGNDVIPSAYHAHVPFDVYSYVTLPVVFTHPPVDDSSGCPQ